MDLKSEFESILREHGHNVYLQRRRDEDESGPYREVAGGRYEPGAEKWTVWRWFPGARRIAEQTFTPEGYVDGIDAVFYFQAEAEVKMADLISEDTPHERAPRATYRVEKIVPYYDGVRCIYLAAHVKKLDPIS